MKSIFWVIFIFGIILIIVHGFFSSVFKVDAFTVLILFILSIPIVAPYLKKAKFPGAEFEFKDEIKETNELVQKSVEQAEKAEDAGEKKILPFETFRLSAVREQLDTDHVLSLAALRIEIEKTLRLATKFLEIPKRNKWSISRIIEVLRKKEVFSSEQISALQKIVNMCNKAIHGFPVSKTDAKKIIDLTEKLNNSFSTGYSIDFSPNEEHEKHGLLCEWEHCIEWLPLTEEDTELSCPVFGHNCPGGKSKVTKCRKAIDDIPESRFVK